jgi:hypothetical protein
LDKHREAEVLSIALIKSKDSISSGVILAKSACHILFNVKIDEEKQQTHEDQKERKNGR